MAVRILKREVFLTLTDSGAQLKDELSGIPKQVAISLNLTEDEFKTLFSLLYKILHNLEFSMQKSNSVPLGRKAWDP